MNKKIDYSTLDVPEDDLESWKRYPKHRWVYDLSRLYDAQNISWSPFPDDINTQAVVNLRLDWTDFGLPVEQPSNSRGYIFIEKPTVNRVLTEVFLVKGEIKLMRHIDSHERSQITGIIGHIELKLSAFCTLHFQKFTGVLTVETYGSDIFAIHLHPYLSIKNETNTDVIKLTKRIFKKQDQQVNGLTDQDYRESLAS